MPSQLCNATGKVAHPTYDAAVASMRSLKRKKGATDLNVYRCGKHWHVGHDVVSLKRRIRNALRGDR